MRKNCSRQGPSRSRQCKSKRNSSRKLSVLCVHTPEITLKSLMTFRTYSELIKLHSFVERYSYLKLRGTVGLEPFAHDRERNQSLDTAKQRRGIHIGSASCQ